MKAQETKVKEAVTKTSFNAAAWVLRYMAGLTVAVRGQENIVPAALVGILVPLCAPAAMAAFSKGSLPAQAAATTTAHQTPQAIPWDQIGVKAGTGIPGRWAGGDADR